MHLGPPRIVDRAGGPRVEADVVWEGPHRGPTTMWFETDAAFADDLDPAPEAFALAALPLACGLGEPRLSIEGRLCTRLRAGMVDAMTLLAHWYPSCRVVPIEAAGGLAPLRPREHRRAALFLSGGVDSLSLLRTNRLTYPREHPASFRDAIFLCGWHSADLDAAGELRPPRRRVNDEQRARLERLAAIEGLTLLPVRGNPRAFLPHYGMLRDVALSACMVAAAHLFPRRWTAVGYASEGHGPGARPHGSHVALDPCHASAAIEVHPGESFTRRMDKLRTLAAWPEGLAALQSCLQFDELPPGRANCGRCEKCRRTMLGLFALGALDAATTFPHDAPLEAVADGYRASTPGQVDFYATAIADALAASGHADLAARVRRQMGRALRRERRRRWRRRIAAFARRLTGGRDAR